MRIWPILTSVGGILLDIGIKVHKMHGEEIMGTEVTFYSMINVKIDLLNISFDSNIDFKETTPKTLRKKCFSNFKKRVKIFIIISHKL